MAYSGESEDEYASTNIILFDETVNNNCTGYQY